MGETAAVTYADGLFLGVVQQIAERFQRLNGMPLRVLGVNDAPEGLWNGSWIKPWLWDILPSNVDRVIWFDADIVPVNPMMDILPESGNFCAVMDVESTKQRMDEVATELRPVKDYFNAGFFVASRAVHPAFNRAKRFMPTRDKPFHLPGYDQNPMNVGIFEEGIQVTKLPRELNWMLAFGSAHLDSIRNLHFAGMLNSNRLPYMKILLKQLEKKEGILCQQHGARGTTAPVGSGVNRDTATQVAGLGRKQIAKVVRSMPLGLAEVADLAEQERRESGEPAESGGWDLR